MVDHSYYERRDKNKDKLLGINKSKSVWGIVFLIIPHLPKFQEVTFRYFLFVLMVAFICVYRLIYEHVYKHWMCAWCVWCVPVCMKIDINQDVGHLPLSLYILSLWRDLSPWTRSSFFCLDSQRVPRIWPWFFPLLNFVMLGFCVGAGDLSSVSVLSQKVILPTNLSLVGNWS